MTTEQKTLSDQLRASAAELEEDGQRYCASLMEMAADKLEALEFVLARQPGEPAPADHIADAGKMVSTEGVSAPDLEPHCGSWIVSDANGNRVWETFERRSADRAVQAGWIVETAAQYLGRINQRNSNVQHRR